jgi:ferric-dicitrate binding protein FerR (iron transport regulator)
MIMKEPNQSAEITDELLWQCLEGNADDEQYLEVRQWICHSPDNRERYVRVRDLWFAAAISQPVEQRQTDRAWARMRRLLQPVHGKRLRAPFRQWLRAAAMLTVAFTAGFAVHAWREGTETPVARAETCTVEATRGSKSRVVLSDGTKVWLNAGSKLDFNTAAGNRTRNVTLEGEAYFEVAHHPEQPFLVTASGIVIRALGTAFNVKAYPEENVIETTLVEGSVRVEKISADNSFKPFDIQTNQSVRFYRKETADMPAVAGQPAPETPILPAIGKIEIIKEINTEKYTSWKDKRWFFDGEKMSNFALTVERMYNVAIFFEDEELKNYKLSGSLEEETIEQLLTAIRLTIPMDYRIVRNRVYLSLNRQLKKEYEKITRQK